MLRDTTFSTPNSFIKDPIIFLRVYRSYGNSELFSVTLKGSGCWPKLYRLHILKYARSKFLTWRQKGELVKIKSDIRCHIIETGGLTKCKVKTTEQLTSKHRGTKYRITHPAWCVEQRASITCSLEFVSKILELHAIWCQQYSLLLVLSHTAKQDDETNKQT